MNPKNIVEVPVCTNADFAYICEGDCMINDRIFDGDIVYIRQQDTVENGEIAAVLVDGKAVLRRVRFLEGGISLEPANPMHKPAMFWGEEMDSVQIIGKAVAFTSAIRI